MEAYNDRMMNFSRDLIQQGVLTLEHFFEGFGTKNKTIEVRAIFYLLTLISFDFSIFPTGVGTSLLVLLTTTRNRPLNYSLSCQITQIIGHYYKINTIIGASRERHTINGLTAIQGKL